MRDRLIRNSPTPLRRADEVVVARKLDRRLGDAYLRFGVDGVRFGWTFGVRASAVTGLRWVEAYIPLHPSDARSVNAVRVVCFRYAVDGPPRGTSMDTVDDELAELARHIRHERLLVAAGWDPFRPPAAAYVTDLITSRAFAARDVDVELLVTAAPRPIRSIARVGRLSRSQGATPYLWAFPFRPVRSPALPDDFFPFRAEFRFSVMERCMLVPGPGVVVVPGAHDGTARVFVDATWPATLLSALPGRKLAGIVEHGIFDDRRIVIIAASATGDRTCLTVTVPTVPLVAAARIVAIGPVSSPGGDRGAPVKRWTGA